MSEIDYERVQFLHDVATECARDGTEIALDADEVILYLTEPLLALRERAEPVEHESHIRREVNVGGNTWVQCSKQAFQREKARGALCRVLYELPTEPPAQVVPDDALTRLAFNIALYFADEETKNNKELFHKLIDHAVDDCRSFMRATIPDPVVADSLVSELLAIAKRAAEEADECANAEFSDNSMKHAREIAEWERRAAILQPVSQHYKLPGKEG